MPAWDDLNARVRGLGTRLMPRPTLERLAATIGVDALAEELRAQALIALEPSQARIIERLEIGVRRRAAGMLGVLSRWAGERRRRLAVVFEDEDRRSLRRVVRGAVQGAPHTARVAGAIPTAALPERALTELAQLDSIGAIAGLLAVWRHPYADVIAASAATPRPDLFALDVALSRLYAARALRQARRCGRELQAFVRQVVDLENVWSALLLSYQGGDIDPDQAFIEGGEVLRSETFRRAVASGSIAAAAGSLRPGFRGTPMDEELGRDPVDVTRLEAAVLATQLRAHLRAARRRPLGTAPILSFVLRLRGEVMDLQRVIAGVTLGAPPTVLTSAFVTPA